MASNLDITEITQDIHMLPGIGAIEYLYNKSIVEIKVFVKGIEVAIYSGDEAKKMHKMVTGITPDLSPYEKMLDETCVKAWGVTLNVLRMKTNKRPLVEYRQIVMWWLALHTKLTLAAIGGLMGGFGHDAVINARTQVNNLKATDMDFKMKVEKFLKAV